ncbi:signal recognition particle-docking protein FtsY [Pseudobacteriovorax antillogorgiicola]|uniref:Signal recognition particle receptor FtsY n=1 Tax=Pseudobacteriovorax antillogorgiicola TaxID=1513793 RepID=A0A1Y6B741_9BACT|nr:signal recognition particle-docking protein FtsY [Pseudobacteriovorax antillogorgiicola]TCS59496.1 signal recognition particle-docking protein FtsY [Pseudobacteriovorax antillogorgiicola]SME87908.1 signal recognition particle-docking protein FtsY [Pseudobacteriovorax antillogorgiicola]
MENMTPPQKLWELLIQNTPNQDPRILIPVLVGASILLFLALYFIFRPKKTTSTAPAPNKTSPEAETIKPASPSQEAETPQDTQPQDVKAIKELDHASWLSKLKGGLAKTRGSLVDGIAGLFNQQKLDDDLLEELHERLFRADLGIDTADTLVDHIKGEFSGREQSPTWDEVRMSLKARVAGMFADSERNLNQPQEGPFVILVVGVNGVGKTTSIGKLAAHFLAQDKNVLLCAADTYRAAAIDQLQVWGDRLGCDVIKHQQGADPASVAYDGVKAAKARKSDVLLIDTAGRLHNKAELMDELAKIRRVIGKDLPEAPHETWIVVDATTGQNAFQQVEAFSQVAPLSGIVVTKLDGTAKGGVVIGVTNKFKLPIRYIGVGEQASDLREFQSSDFADSLF